MDILDFPTVPVSKQLFHVPGGALEGGFTSGAVRLLSPDPAGRSVLELQLALQVQEWSFPITSWLMSQGNGEVFKIRLAPTPQVLSNRSAVTWDNDILWSGDTAWEGDIAASFASAALEGTETLQVLMTGLGDIIRPGHVIGYGSTAHLIQRVTYDPTTQIATCKVKPPVRRNVVVGETAYFRPFFTGTIANIGDVRATYDAENDGHIQPGKIVFAEAIV